MVVLIIKNQCLICSYKNQHICNFGRCKFSLTVDILEEICFVNQFWQMFLLNPPGQDILSTFILLLKYLVFGSFYRKSGFWVSWEIQVKSRCPNCHFPFLSNKKQCNSQICTSITFVRLIASPKVWFSIELQNTHHVIISSDLSEVIKCNHLWFLLWLSLINYHVSTRSFIESPQNSFIGLWGPSGFNIKW